MFTPNHHLHNDNAIILCSIPLSWRRRLSVAAALDGIFKSSFRGFWAAVIGNAFPLAREGAVRRSLDLLGARLDRGYSILIYPEGSLTVGGPLQEFKSGTGLVAIHGAIPVVPMRLKIHRYSRFDKDAPSPAARGEGMSRSSSASRSGSRSTTTRIARPPRSAPRSRPSRRPGLSGSPGGRHADRSGRRGWRPGSPRRPPGADLGARCTQSRPLPRAPHPATRAFG